MFVAFGVVEGLLPACFWPALQVSGPFLFSSAPLSLSLCSSLLQPLFHLGAGLVGCGVCLVGAVDPRVRASFSFIVRHLFVSFRILRAWRPVVALSCLRGGVQLFCFPVAPTQSILPALSGLWVVFLALYSACLLVPVHLVFAVPCGFGVGLPLSSIRALRSASLRPLGCSTTSYLLSRRYCLSPALVFSVPSPISSSWAPLSRFSWRRGLPPLPV